MTHPGRYSTRDMDRVWSEQNSQHINHGIWLTVHATQLRLQPALPSHPQVGEAYRTAADLLGPSVDGEDNMVRMQHWVDTGRLESQLRHQTLARLEAFERLAVDDRHVHSDQDTPHPYYELHRGMTSCDITDNTHLIQAKQAMQLIVEHLVIVIDILAVQAEACADVKTVGRTHGLPAQVTTLGHRWAAVLQPLLNLYSEAQDMLREWPLRGIHGAVGTSADQLATLQDDGNAPWRYSGATGSALDVSAGPEAPESPREAAEATEAVFSWVDARDVDRLDEVDVAVGERYDIDHFWAATSQIYHRSYDQRITDWLTRLASVGQTYAQLVRHMVMLGLGRERPADEQLGSSAMPHKDNPRYAERVCALVAITRGYHHMVVETAGAPWLEGDVSTSATRTVAVPGAFKTVDSLLAVWRHVATHFEPDARAMQREVADNVELLSTGLLLAAAIRSGASRQTAYEAIRAASHKDPLQLGIWAQRLALQSGMPLSYRTILRILRHVALTGTPVGDAQRQIRRVTGQAAQIVADHRPLVDWEVQLP